MDTVNKRECVLPRVLAFAKQHNMTWYLPTHLSASVSLSLRFLSPSSSVQLFRAARARSILISHDLGAVCPLVDRVYVLERGALVQQVPAALCSCSLSLSLSLSLSHALLIMPV